MRYGGTMDLSSYKNKKVLITGHTGFKGSWMSMVLLQLGAVVCGYSLLPATKENLFDLCDLDEKMNSYIGDIRDLNRLQEVFNEVKPTSVKDMGAIMKAITPLVKGKADMSIVNKVIGNLLV